MILMKRKHNNEVSDYENFSTPPEDETGEPIPGMTTENDYEK